MYTESFLFRLLCILSVLLTFLTSVYGANCKARCNLAHGSCDESGKCRCDPGWEGEQCEMCVRMPGCANGTCHQPWQCMCESGWTGRFCDKEIYICDHQKPCQNNANCTDDLEGDYFCTCPEGFLGKNCELKKGPCETTWYPCKNGGTCWDDNGYASNLTCRCLAGFVGTFCEINVDDCLMRPCANGATCHDGVNRFICECQPGFEGRFCTVNLDDCASNPCKNGGKCYDLVNDFSCVCPDGYVGKNCTIPVTKPDSNVESKPPPQISKATDRHVTRTTTSRYSKNTFSQPIRSPDTVRQNYTSLSQSTQQPDRGLVISVKEVVNPSHFPLTRTQIIIVAVFGICTLLLVAVTTGLILKSRRKQWHKGRHCQSVSNSVRNRTEQECQVSFLSKDIPEPSKTQDANLI
ncbi:protein delta homolog 2 [Protopterus annectens]|uniref:protein delta homolog 2 n=1 Tax=Protopterus annectens TaxID=7888 RepID=UPI001CFB2A1D|nr:protein delta homolog 2 [Protopterus annectens]